MQCNAFSYQIFRNDRKSKANTCKSGIFGKAAQFDRTGACTFTLINTVRNIFFCNICFISGIIDDYCTDFQEFADRNNADEVIVLLSSFDVDSSGGDGSLNPNSTYNNWNWILVRTKGGKWQHIDHGY